MIFTEVRCDKCGSVGLSRRCFYARQMREELKKSGWNCSVESGKDFCPECKPRRKPRRRSRTAVAAKRPIQEVIIETLRGNAKDDTGCDV